MPSRLSARVSIPALLMVLLFSIVLACSIGTVSVPLTHTVSIILSKIGIRGLSAFTQAEDSIIYLVRLPRVLAAAEVGAALGISGAVMQAVLRNPLADPGIIGVSAGASLGAVIAIYSGAASLHLFATPAAAFAGALAATFLVYSVATVKGRTPAGTLLLAGVAASAFFGGVTSAVLSFSSDYQMRQMVFWMMGGLSGRGFEHLRMTALPIGLGMVLILLLGAQLNILSLGDRTASVLGLAPERTRRFALALSALVTGTAVSIAGTIGFVGLIVPHMIRIVSGPDNRVLLPASAVGGAILVVLADLAARTVVAPIELRIGIVTAFLGAPFFIYLLRKRHGIGGAVS